MSARSLVTLAALATATTFSSLSLAQEAAPADAALQPLPSAAPPAAEPAPPSSTEPLPPPAPATSTTPTFSRAENPSAPDEDRPVERPRDKKHQPFMMSAMVGYGTQSLNGSIALRLAYVAPGRFFIGGLFQYYFGESTTQGIGGFATETGVTYFIHQMELGYSGKIGPVEIRPYAGLGPAVGFSSRSGYQAPFSRPDQTRATAAITPIALAINVDVGSHAYVGIDGRPIFFPQTMIPQGSFGGVVGARF